MHNLDNSANSTHARRREYSEHGSPHIFGGPFGGIRCVFCCFRCFYLSLVKLLLPFVLNYFQFSQRLIYAFVIVRLDRRDLIWIDVTRHPTAEWIARQITEAFPWNEAPRYLIRDRDRIFGAIVTRRLRAMGIRDKPIAPASPWQNAFAERLIGSIRRECVDHIIVLGEAHLRRILRCYARYYNEIRTHRALNKDAPRSRAVQQVGIIKSHAILGGLHHQYVRI